MFSKARWMLPLLILPLFVVACDDDDPFGGNTASIDLMLTDDFGDHVDNVWIEVDSVYLTGTGGRTVLYSLDDDESPPGLIELTELGSPDPEAPGSAVLLIQDVEIPAGSYGQLRFVIRSAVLESDDRFWTFNGAEPPDGGDVVGDLNCPSCTQSGIKAILPSDEANIEAGSHVMVLDFDVGRSFGREAGMSGQWVMSPVILVTMLEFSGAIQGTVDFQRDGEGGNIPTDVLADPFQCPAGDAPVTLTAAEVLDVFEVTAERTGGELQTQSADSEGNYAFGILLPGEYTMGYTASMGVAEGWDVTFTADVIPPDPVQLESATVETVDFKITSVGCEGVTSG